MNYPKVAVQILLHHEPFEEIERLMRSLTAVDYPPDRWLIVIINNDLPGHDIAGYLRAHWLIDGENSKLPCRVIFERQTRNLGFTGGHMLAKELAREFKPDYLYLLNGDTTVDSPFLWRAVQVAEEKPDCALIQSRVMLAQEPERLNTIGNALHFLGFGFSVGHGDLPDKIKKHLPIFYPSGAGLLVRVKILEKIGGFFERSFFLYHEDVDLGWRARLAGFKIGYAPDSVIFHHYEFSRSIKKFYWMERNRLLALFLNYRLATILLIAPVLFIVEFGVFWFARRKGWGREKIFSWLHFWKPSTLIFICCGRRLRRSFRIVKDREILNEMTGLIINQEVENLFLTRWVNPILNFYLQILRWIVKW